MIVDTSAIIAILRNEPEADRFAACLAMAGGGSMSAASWVELTAVVVRQHPGVDKADVDLFLREMRIEIAVVTVAQARLGEAAYRQYGRGTMHPAKLNFGDCLAYALAKETGEPLLFRGNDFSHTDIAAAIS